ncbi:MAG TPA: hypothetical protein VEC39_20675 [Vicinamibacterales bacterium]|nr:hypothetical protein [Vicinamibacterales bacterium]
MMRVLIVAALLAIGVGASVAADVNQLAGRWIGGVVTARGTMDIALNLSAAKNKLIGVLKTDHGDWEISGVAEKDGVWTIGMQSPGGPATMSGRIKGSVFSGQWNVPGFEGTFELTRAKKQ